MQVAQAEEAEWQALTSTNASINNNRINNENRKLCKQYIRRESHDAHGTLPPVQRREY